MMIKEYQAGDVTVLWQADKCIHSANCVRNLPNVFQPKEKPWIKIDQANTEDIVSVVEHCPSGALSIKRASNT
jgi:uncharacterized Fe-S cluster protein YjdI